MFFSKGRLCPTLSMPLSVSLDIMVNDYAALKDMIRNNYSGRLADVLEVKE